MDARADALVFSESHAAYAGGLTMRNVWMVSAATRYDVAISEWQNGAWREMWRMTMRPDRR